MNALVKKIFFNRTPIKTFFITRLDSRRIEEKVFLKAGKTILDVTCHHAMICLDPFCMAVWLSDEDIECLDPHTVHIQFKKGTKLNADIRLLLIEQIKTGSGTLLLYSVSRVKNYQLNPLHRLVFFAYLLRSKANTYQSRKVISALYSYPRSIIIVSYKDDSYYNIFPMDIQGYIQQEGLYILGLRTTNITLNKILEARKVIVCDTDKVDITTVYNLGKHSSSAPTQINDLPFGVYYSEKFGFPVPDFTGSYKEIEIIHYKKMGYHMLMVGKVIYEKQVNPEPLSLYHVGFLQYQDSKYESIEGVF